MGVLDELRAKIARALGPARMQRIREAAMSLRVGDHLRIQRDGVLVDPNQEAYHEFEVLGSLGPDDDDGNRVVQPYVATTRVPGPDETITVYDVRIRVVR